MLDEYWMKYILLLGKIILIGDRREKFIYEKLENK